MSHASNVCCSHAKGVLADRMSELHPLRQKRLRVFAMLRSAINVHESQQEADRLSRLAKSNMVRPGGTRRQSLVKWNETSSPIVS